MRPRKHLWLGDEYGRLESRAVQPCCMAGHKLSSRVPGSTVDRQASVNSRTARGQHKTVMCLEMPAQETRESKIVFRNLDQAGPTPPAVSLPMTVGSVANQIQELNLAMRWQLQLGTVH